MKCEICGKYSPMAYVSHRDAVDQWLCDEHYWMVRRFTDGLKPKPNEPLTWRLEPHGSRPANSTKMGCLFGCDVWYDPDMVERTYNDWRERQTTQPQPEVKIEHSGGEYRIDHGDCYTRIGAEVASALYEHMRAERGDPVRCYPAHTKAEVEHGHNG